MLMILNGESVFELCSLDLLSKDSVKLTVFHKINFKNKNGQPTRTYHIAQGTYQIALLNTV